MTESHQDLFPKGLVNLDRQDLDKALTGTAIAALSLCTSAAPNAPQSLILS